MPADHTSLAARLNALMEVARAATEGEWWTAPCTGGGAILERGPREETRTNRHVQGHLQIVPVEDAEHIANFHPTIGIALARVAKAAANVREWGVEFDDVQLRYVSVQVDRADAEELDAAFHSLRLALGMGETP